MEEMEEVLEFCMKAQSRRCGEEEEYRSWRKRKKMRATEVESDLKKASSLCKAKTVDVTDSTPKFLWI